MDIQTLKTHLDLYAVAARLGIQVNKYHKAHCPFHEDKRPSLQFSKEKQIATCFSGHCSAGTMDVISLTEKKLNVSTHEAIKWLQQEFNLQDHQQAEAKLPQTNYPKLFRVFAGNLKKSSKAKEYLHSRGLASVVSSGLAGYNGTAWEKMRNCIIFPLRDRQGQIVSFYGRSTVAQNHFYNSNRKGLYPSYPKAEIETLILTESVIDCATLQPFTAYRALALYGTNGLTPEHIEAIKELAQLKEIILFLDGDAAGKEAVKKNGEILHNLRPEIKLTYVETPEGEDINSLTVNHQGQEQELFSHLIKDRKPLSSLSTGMSVQAGSKESEPITKGQSEHQTKHTAKLITDNPELLFYQNYMPNGSQGVLNFTVLGGIKITGLDRLRVTLKIAHQDKNHLLPLRHNLDLYNNGQVEQLGQKVAEQMEVTTQESVTAIAQLTNELEGYRERQLEALKPKKETKPILSHLEQSQGLEALKSPDLMQETMKRITQSGIVGEERNAFIAYLVYTSRKRENPLHLMCLGASGTGKTHLQEKVGELIPEEDKLEITTLSENAFYYFGKEELKHKLILIEDLDGAEAVLYPLRELQSKRRISKTVTLKDNKGNLKTVTLKVEGPVSVSGCTTREKLYEDNANRCLLIYIDSSAAQDKKIMAYQQGLSSGSIDKAKEQENRQRLQNMQRLLKPIHIRNPYASMIQLPERVFKPRRTMLLLLSFIETITFYHQYQRQTSTDRHTGETFIATTPEDIQWAFRLLKEALFAKSDELTGACRKFLETLKGYLDKKAGNDPEKRHNVFFKGQEIRRALRLAPSTLKRYLLELTRYGYLKIVGGSKYKGFEYQVADSQEYEQLRNSIDQQLEAILQNIKSAQ